VLPKTPIVYCILDSRLIGDEELLVDLHRPWEIDGTQAPRDDHHATLFEQAKQFDNRDCPMYCMLYLSQLFYTFITLVPCVGSLDLPFSLYVHDTSTGQISPGRTQPKNP
jgi:hypothetical protein